MRWFEQPIVIATYRAVVGGLVMAGGAYFAALENHAPQSVALIAAGAAFFGYLVLRGGLEGIIDQKAA